MSGVSEKQLQHVDVDLLCGSLQLNTSRKISYPELKNLLLRLYSVHLKTPLRNMEVAKQMFPMCKVVIIKSMLRWVTFIEAAIEVFGCREDGHGASAVTKAIDCLQKHNCVLFIARSIVAAQKDVICCVLRTLDSKERIKRKLGLSNLKTLIAHAVDTSESRPVLWKLKTEAVPQEASSGNKIAPESVAPVASAVTELCVEVLSLCQKLSDGDREKLLALLQQSKDVSKPEEVSASAV